MYQTLEYSCEQAVALVRLNRPEKLNAINREMVGELGDVVRRIHDDEDVRAVVVTGNGRAFSAGADISRLVELAGPPDFLNFIEEVQTTFNALEDLNRPTIAAVN